MYIHTYTYILYIPTFYLLVLSTHTHIYLHTYIHIYTRIDIYIRIYTHTYIYRHYNQPGRSDKVVVMYKSSYSKSLALTIGIIKYS